MKLKLGALGAWPKIEPKIIEKLEGILRRVDSDGKPIPLDRPTIDNAHRWLVAQFVLPDHLVEPPTFALRIYHYFKAKNPPEASLLNSFFLGDLARGAALVGQNAVPAGLRGYLGIERPKETFDLLGDKAFLEKAVAPAMMPAARWPGPGGYPLVMLQQAAVNLARSELAGGEGIFAVNGPPGTGKTTLLRDVVAACVLDRALAMAAFEDPEKAFTPSGEKMSAGEKAFFHLYTLAPSLKGMRSWSPPATTRPSRMSARSCRRQRQSAGRRMSRTTSSRSAIWSMDRAKPRTAMAITMRSPPIRSRPGA